jgi:hypothetical protein
MFQSMDVLRTPRFFSLQGLQRGTELRLRCQPSEEEISGYTVGYICSITTKYVAAQAFLNKKHKEPEFLLPADYHNYTLGNTGKHNVVVAILPDAKYGIPCATTVVINDV